MKIFLITISKLKQIFLMGCFLILCTNLAHSQDSKGTEFWICFPGNEASPSPQLYITSELASTVTINAPGIGFNQVVNVPAGGLQVVSIPSTIQVQSQFIIENKSIHITATSEVTIYGMNAQDFTTDAYLAFPLDAIGKEYYVMAYNRDFGFLNPTQATIVATENNTTVTITSSLTAGGFTAGVPTDILLQQGDVYQLRSVLFNADYTGTKVVSDKPVSVFGGAQCTNISGSLRACDHLVEQMPPLTSWGKSFVTVPLATRLAGDVFRFLAQKNNTVVSVNGIIVATLNAGQFFETILGSTTYNRVTSTEPILVGQYSRSSQADQVTSDPFFALVPPDEQFLNQYVVSAGTLNIPNNFVNITSPTSNTGTVMVDGLMVATGLWNSIPATTFSGAKVPITTGVHSISSTLPIGVLVYGFGNFDSYGYLGGQSFSPVATVSSLNLSPKTGTAPINTNKCWEALVKDQFDAPVAGVRVDFAIVGPNSTSSGFANTNANGVATFCYTGTNGGDDMITASVGSITDDAAFTWISGCNVTVTAKKYYDLNTDGIDNDNMPVQNWPITLSGVTENNVAVGPINQSTDAGGLTMFTGIAKGSYTVAEGSKANWINTTPTSAALTLGTCTDPAQVKFGNVCLGAGSATSGTYGLGWWSNKNGQAVITASNLCALNVLCLRNANGSNFDPVAGCLAPSNAQVNAGKSALKTWLLDAFATNMSYMLSAQLAAMKLNVLNGYVNGTKLIYAPGSASANAAGFATVNAIMTEANNILCANPTILAGNPLRAIAESVKNALDKANNNLNFVQLQPCSFAQPIAPIASSSRQGNNTPSEEIQTGMELSVVPNPARDFFNISINTHNSHDKITLRAIDLQGKVLVSLNGLRNGQVIQFGRTLAPGTYLIEMIQGKESKTKTVIKQ